MKFTIRDLFLVTVIVALAVTWLVERSRLQRENWRLIRENDAFKVQAQDEHNMYLAASAGTRMRRVLDAELRSEINRLEEKVRNSQAPAPNQPKP